MSGTAPPDTANGYLLAHASLMAESYRRWTGRDLVDPQVPAGDVGHWLYVAPFVLLSHGTGDEPLFTYANRTALLLFELTWAELVILPSRRSAEPVEQEERSRLLAEVTAHGFIDDYAGIRVSRSGRRFRIEAATVWNLVDASGTYRGQAATFSHWHEVEA
jgi:MEKHLA domain.